MQTLLRSFALATALCLTTTAIAETFKDATGSVELNSVPQKIVTFDLAPLDTFDTLGVTVTGVIKPHALGYLSKFQADKYVNVGTFWEPDFETVAAMQPDLIVLGPRTAKFKGDFTEFAPSFDSSVWGENFLDQFYSMTTTLAAMVDKEVEAEQHLDSIKNMVAEVKNAAQTSGNALIIQVSGGKITAYGRGSRFGWIHDDLGLIPAVADVQAATHGDPISFEFLKSVNPDWIFVLDRDAAIGQSGGSAKALLNNEIVNSISAAQNNQIVYLDGVAWYMVAYGLTAMNNQVSEIHQAIVR